MLLLDLTFDSPAENLALDEALLDTAEQAAQTAPEQDDYEVLRIWEPPDLLVVAGSSSRLADEVHLDRCRAAGLPVLRRASGGTTIVTGPGCLMYAVVLSYARRPELRSIDRAHQFVLDSIAAGLNRVMRAAASSSGATAGLPSGIVARAGISDLAWNDRKFSGNSLRCKRRFLLYHGTLLYRFPLEEISKFLKMPLRQPAYRSGRSHDDFLTNLPVEAATLRRALTTAFDAHNSTANWPRELMAQLAQEKYSRSQWNQRL